MYHLSSHAPTCAAPQTAAVKNRENWLSPPPFAMKRPSLRDRAAGKLPFRGLGCHFVDQNVALLSHPVPQTAVSTVQVRSHTKDTHKSTEWKTGHTAQPLFAPQALTRRRWHGWLQEVRHLRLPLLGWLLLSCCVSCCAGPPQVSGCCSSTNAPAQPTGIISWRV